MSRQDAFYSDHNLYLVLELCTGGDFFSLISRDPLTGKGGGACLIVYCALPDRALRVTLQDQCKQKMPGDTFNS